MDPGARAWLHSLDRFFVWACPVLAVLAVAWGVGNLVVGQPVRAAVFQFLLAVLLVVNGFSARTRRRRDRLPDERR
ncbi:hypothetical protein DQ392_27400 [Streptomyces reniochalinae]|uniref:Uncharacterized protein n=1 Tax=Streptomyces reniochalinae TaxID=2250578 RepID=A0A367EAK9_9ACTN|nr:hypothetical protein DQ392_27400 [Streptomyces reniochalinae]